MVTCWTVDHGTGPLWRTWCLAIGATNVEVARWSTRLWVNDHALWGDIAELLCWDSIDVTLWGQLELGSSWLSLDQLWRHSRVRLVQNSSLRVGGNGGQLLQAVDAGHILEASASCLMEVFRK